MNAKSLELVSKHLATGNVIVVGEFRGIKQDVVNYADKKTGAAASFEQIKYLVEVGQGDAVEALSCVFSIPKGKTLADYPLTVKKGDQVLVTVQSIVEEKRVKTVRINAIVGLPA